jgi:hypothetical protein
MGDSLRLPTAMAISGAAVNPNTGVGGSGLTRNRPVALLLSLLNIRLGYWALNPRTESGKFKRERFNHFEPGLVSAIGDYHTERRRFIELTDGGHFENLALYELVRRRCRLIVVCDGGADPGYQFGDLDTALRRIDVDFGVRISFDGWNNALQRLVPSLATRDSNFPKGVEIAEKGFVVGTIHYPEIAGVCPAETGTLVFMTTTLIPGLDRRILAYKGRNPEFPDQSTGDQFFDEEQFEAYRGLGYAIASGMIESGALDSCPRHASSRSKEFP